LFSIGLPNAFPRCVGSPFLFTRMNFIDKVLGRVGLLRKGAANMPLVQGMGNGSDPFAIFRGNQTYDAGQALDEYHGWVYACTRAIAEELAKTQFKLMQVASDDSEEEVRQHEMLDLLAKPSPFMTGWELLHMLASHLEACGNAYWYLSGVKNENDIPDMIVPLVPRYMKMLKAPLPTFCTGYEYKIDGKTTTYKPYEIVHFRYPNPNDPYEGMGTVQAIMSWIVSEDFQTRYNLKFFKNGARIGGFLESDSAKTPEQLDYLKKSFEGIYAGIENAHKVAALPKGTKYTPSSESQKDMEFVEGQQLNRDKILAGFKVPKPAIGITDDVNRANAEATDYIFASRTILPKLEMICAFLNAYLTPRFGEDIYLTYVDPTPENRELLVSEMQASVGQSGILSPDEAREKYFGLGPVENGDQVRAPINSQPIGAPAPKPQKAQAPKAKTITRSGRFNKKKKIEKVSSEIADAVKDIAEGVAKEYKQRMIVKAKAVAEMSDEQRAVAKQNVEALKAPYEKLLASTLHKFNAKQKAEVLKNISEKFKAGINNDDLFDQAQNIKTLTKNTNPIFTDLFRAIGLAAAEQIGFGGFDSNTQRIRDAIEQAVNLMADSYTGTTLDLLKEKLNDALDAGAGLDELKSTISDVYAFQDEVSAARVARTESFRVSNMAAKEAWSQSGVVKTLKWVVAGANPCPYCEELNGKTVGVDDNFFDQGDTVSAGDASMTLDYSDVGAPPLHPNCECDIVPDEISID